VFVRTSALLRRAVVSKTRFQLDADPSIVRIRRERDKPKQIHCILLTDANPGIRTANTGQTGTDIAEQLLQDGEFPASGRGFA